VRSKVLTHISEGRFAPVSAAKVASRARQYISTPLKTPMSLSPVIASIFFRATASAQSHFPSSHRNSNSSVLYWENISYLTEVPFTLVWYGGVLDGNSAFSAKYLGRKRFQGKV